MNGAGVNSPTPFLEISEEEFEKIITVNLKGVVLACQIFGKHMLERGSGSIINIGSAFRPQTALTSVHLLSQQSRRTYIFRKTSRANGRPKACA